MATQRRISGTRLLVIGLIWASALAVAAYVVRYHIFRDTPPAPLLGEEYRNETWKLSFRPPANWQLEPMPPEYKQALEADRAAFAEHFAGPEIGDACSIAAHEVDGSLQDFARQTLAGMPPELRPRCTQGFFEINGMPAWMCEWTLSREVMLHQLTVVVKRGGLRVLVRYAAVQTSYQRQKQAIARSVQSLNFW